MPPSYGNATIGQIASPHAGGEAVQIAIAVNQMKPGAQAGMINAHVGQNYNVSEPSDARAALLAADGTPGLNGSAAKMTWSVPNGVWVINP